MEMFYDKKPLDTWLSNQSPDTRIHLSHTASVENSGFADRLLDAEDEKEPVELMIVVEGDPDTVVFTRRGVIERLNVRYSFQAHVIYTNFSVSVESNEY